MRPEEKEIVVPMVADGVLNAAVFWFDLFLDEETTLTTSPFAKEKTDWNQTIQYLPPIKVKKDDPLPLTLKHDGYKISFELMLNKIEADKRIPEEHDEIWRNNFLDTERRYQEMIMRCVGNPDDYMALVDAATKLASDPGGFNCRPKYALRFAESFFIR